MSRLIFLFLYFLFDFDAVGLSKSREVENETKQTKANENQRGGLRSLSMSCSVSSPVKATLDLTKIFKEIKTNITLPKKKISAYYLSDLSNPQTSHARKSHVSFVTEH